MTDDDYSDYVQSHTTIKVHADLKAREPGGLLHAAIGLCTEAGEVMDAVKRHLYYGTPLDKQNLLEELGDILFYLVMLANALGVTLEEVRDANVRKLTARYPTGAFTTEDAVNRDKDAEMKALDNE